MYPLVGLASPMFDDSDNFHFEMPNTLIMFVSYHAVMVEGVREYSFQVTGDALEHT